MADKRWRVTLAGPEGEYTQAGTFLTQMKTFLAPHVELVTDGPRDLTIEAIASPHVLPPDEGAWWVYLPDDAPILTGEWIDSIKSFADQIFVAHGVLRDRLVTAGVDPTRIVVLYPGVDPAVFVAEGEAEPRQADRFCFLYVGAVDWVSGIDALLAAYRQAFSAGSPVSLLVADPSGSAAGEEALRDLMEKMGWESGPPVQYRELSPNLPEERARLFRSHDVMICPQRLVGSAQILREALACGMEVLTSDRPHGLRAGQTSRFVVTTEHQTRGKDVITWCEPVTDNLASHLWNLSERGDRVRDHAALLADEVRAAHGWEWVAAELARRLGQWEGGTARERLQSVLDHLETGLQALDQGNLNTAEQRLGEALALDTNLPEALIGLAFAAHQRGAWGKALDYLTRHMDVRPGDPRALNLTGVCLFRSGEKVLAKRFFEELLRVEPTNQAAKRSLTALGNVGGEVGESFRGLAAQLEKTKRSGTPRLSVCLIAKDEEAFIGQCLASVQGVADEIIVVDTGSTDRTVKIAEEFGAKVHFFAWNNSFSDARNESLKHATGDWILCLDADEVLDPDSIPYLKMVMEKPTEKVPLYLPKIVNIVGSAEGAEVEHYMVRMFPNDPEISFQGVIHEQARHERDEMVERAALPELRILHYGYRSETIESRDKESRNINLLEMAIQQEPDHSFHYFNMGVTLRMSDRYAESQTYLYQAVDMAFMQNIQPVFLTMAYVYILTNYLNLDRPAEVIGVGSKVRDLCGDAPEYWVAMGVAFLRLNKPAEAAPLFEHAIGMDTRFSVHIVDRGSTTWKPKMGLASALSRIGREQEARELYTALLEGHPHPAEVRFLLADLEFRTERHEEAEEHLRWILLHASQGETWDKAWPIWLQLAAACEAEEGLKVLRRLPRVPEALKPWALTALQQRQFEEAIEVASQWMELTDDAEAYQTRSEARIQLDDLDGAEADLRAALERAPNDKLWSNLGLVALRRGLLGEANTHFLKALESNPDSSSARINLAQLAYLEGKSEEAREWLAKGPDGDKVASDALLLRATMAMDQGQWAEARNLLGQLLAEDSQSVAALVRLGYVELEEEAYQAALEPFSKALQLGCQDLELYRGLGMALLNLQQYEDAENAFRLALEQDSDDPVSRRGLQISEGLRLAGSL